MLLRKQLRMTQMGHLEEIPSPSLGLTGGQLHPFEERTSGRKILPNPDTHLPHSLCNCTFQINKHILKYNLYRFKTWQYDK